MPKGMNFAMRNPVTAYFLMSEATGSSAQHRLLPRSCRQMARLHKSSLLRMANLWVPYCNTCMTTVVP